jgi:hypothetical protein
MGPPVKKIGPPTEDVCVFMAGTECGPIDPEECNPRPLDGKAQDDAVPIAQEPSP